MHSIVWLHKLGSWPQQRGRLVSTAPSWLKPALPIAPIYCDINGETPWVVVIRDSQRALRPALSAVSPLACSPTDEPGRPLNTRVKRRDAKP